MSKTLKIMGYDDNSFLCVTLLISLRVAKSSNMVTSWIFLVNINWDIANIFIVAQYSFPQLLLLKFLKNLERIDGLLAT